MSKQKAQAFFEKKKEETKGKMKEGDDKKSADTSKMPEGLRKHFEKKNGKSDDKEPKSSAVSK